jgi:hypothetical protein
MATPPLSGRTVIATIGDCPCPHSVPLVMSFFMGLDGSSEREFLFKPIVEHAFVSGLELLL